MPPELLGAWDGARAAIGEPLALLIAVAAAIAALPVYVNAPSRAARHAFPLALFLAVALGTRWVSPSPLHAAVAATLLAMLGAISALAWRVGGRVHLLAATLGGVGFGLAAGLPVSIGAEAAGTLLVGGVLYLSALAAAVQLQRRWHHQLPMRLAPRILGAWATAIGLLLMALHVWGRPG